MASGGDTRVGFRITDGVIKWFNGPEWDDVAARSMETFLAQLESRARADAIWEDRTGDARAKLHAGIQHRGGEIEVYLEHGVEYGYWLEVIQNGRFAIIMPTIEREAPRLFNNAARRVAYARRGSN